jgi:predicted nuclease with TOPRIM domain
MFSLQIVVAVVSALVGAALPLVKAIIKVLQRSPRGEVFFATPFGKQVLATFDLDRPRDTTATLFKELADASAKMDGIVARIREYTKGREPSVAKFEEQLGLLTQQEADLRKRIEDLKQVPLPAAQYFATLVNKREKSSALRDYLLFTAGIVVSAIVTVILKHFSLA